MKSKGLVLMLVFFSLFSLASASIPSTNNLVAYYSFEETAGNVLDTFGVFDGIIEGDVNRGALGKIGKAYNLTGSSNINSFNINSNLSDFSIAFWFKDNFDVLLQNTSHPSDQYIIKGIKENEYNREFYINTYSLTSGHPNYLPTGRKYIEFRFPEGLSSGGARVVGKILQPHGSYLNNSWRFVVISYSSTGRFAYLNLDNSYNNFSFFPSQTYASSVNLYDILIGAVFTNFSIDELMIFNKSLSPVEVSSLYNNGSGYAYPPKVVLNYPTALIDYGKKNGTLQLNFTATDTNLDKVWYNYDGTNVTITGAVSGVANLSNITLSTDKEVEICANDTAGNENCEVFGWDYKVFENSRAFNTTTFETKNETFLINLTANSSLTNVYLNYNGVDYLTTKTGNIYSKTLPMELVATDTNRTFYYKFEYAGTNITSPTSIQLVKTYLVNWTGTKQYVNITIKDEYDNTIINSTTMDTLFDYYIHKGGYTNIHQEIKTEDGIFGFSATPNIDRWSGFGRLYYYATGYQPRYFFIDDEEFTNTTITQKTLYLLLQTDGILVRYKIYDNIGNELENVRISAYKKVGSSEILVEQVLTDSLGEASLFLNPNYYHRILITNEGCTTIDRTRRITSSDTYTEFMTCGNGGGGGGGMNLTTFENVTSSFSPYSPVQYTNNTVTFSFTSTDSNCNLDETTYILKFGGTNLISLTGNNPCGQTLSQSVNLENYSGTLVGYGIMKIGDSQITLTKRYTVLNIGGVVYNQTSVNSLLDKLKDPNFGLEIGLTPTTKALICFLILFGLIASFGNLTNKDNIPIMLVLICLFLFICSYMNFLTVFNSDYDWLNQYGILLLVGIFTIGVVIRRYV